MKAVNAKMIPNGDIPVECNLMYPDSDKYWICVFRSTAVSGGHPAGTCRMGNTRDRTTVVDPELKYV